MVSSLIHGSYSSRKRRALRFVNIFGFMCLFLHDTSCLSFPTICFGDKNKIVDTNGRYVLMEHYILHNRVCLKVGVKLGCEKEKTDVAFTGLQ